MEGEWSKPSPGLFTHQQWPLGTHCTEGRISLWASLDGLGINKVFCSQRSRDTSYNSFCCFRHWIQQNHRLLIILILTVILMCQLMFTRFWGGMYWNVCRKLAGNRKVMVCWLDTHSRGLSKTKGQSVLWRCVLPTTLLEVALSAMHTESVEPLAGIERTINNNIFHDMEDKVRFTP